VNDQSNRKALELYPWIESIVRGAVDPLDAALRIALAGNMIDCGRGSVDGLDMRKAVLRYLEADFALDDRARLFTELDGARSILYVLDNAGEIVFDRLLVERLGARRVVCAVRSGPIINDATYEDARLTGLTEVCEVIPSGSDASGTPIEACSARFREVFESSDIVIAKGQGNFETLFDEHRDVFHLFVAKCPVITDEIGAPQGGALAFFNSSRGRTRASLTLCAGPWCPGLWGGFCEEDLLVLCILPCAVAVLAALPFVVDLNRHKGEILELLGRYTERRVDFERVDLTVLNGIGARVRA
jgi:uncharacterized protein with ATP-grasp and redox domains